MAEGAGVITKPLMFLSSYAPLLALLAIRFDDCRLRSVCAGLAVLGFVALFALMRLQHQPPAYQGRYNLTAVRQAGEGASSYLAGYLLPFVTIGSPGVRDIVAYLGFFLVAYVVTTRTGIIQVNPTLFLAGYKIYRITDSAGAQRYLLTKTKETIAAGTTVMASRMSNDVLVFESIATPPSSRLERAQ